jgi:hypothetical protein
MELDEFLAELRQLLEEVAYQDEGLLPEYLLPQPREAKLIASQSARRELVLESVAGIIPGGDAVKEFKESVEAGAEDMDDGSVDETTAAPPE